MLISYSGSLAAVTGAPELIGKPIGELHQDWEAKLSSIQDGKDIIQQDHENIELFKSIYFGNTTTPGP